MSGKIKALFDKYKSTLVQFLKFNFVGIANTLIDWGVFALFNTVLGLHLFIAKPISFVCGIVNSFILNKFWTFKKKEQNFKGLELVKFLVVNLISLAANMLVMWLLKSKMGVNPTISNILVTPVTFVINFVFYKLWVFKGHEESPNT